MRFTDGYVEGPNCSPSRARFLTGRIPTRFGDEFNPTGALNEQHGFGLPAREVTIAQTLQNAGSTTEWLGGRPERDYEKLQHGEKFTVLPDEEQMLEETLRQQGYAAANYG